MTTAVPPKIKSATPLKFFAATALAFAFFGVAATVFFFNPGHYRFYPVCLFHELTGLNCPGCGSTRAFYALLHGNFMRALKDNALFIFSFFGGAIFFIHFIFRKWRNPQTVLHWSPKIFWTYFAIAIVFGVVRNLPAFAFLSP